MIYEKRIYSDEDVKLIKKLIKRFRKIKFIGKDKFECKIVQKTLGSKLKTFENPIWRQFPERRQEQPKILRPYQVVYIVKYKCLPFRPFELSHLCGNRFCVIAEHIRCERKYLNSQRKSCHRKYKKYLRKLRNGGKRGIIILRTGDCGFICPHGNGNDQNTCFFVSGS
jgi:hypothetical protein